MTNLEQVQKLLESGYLTVLQPQDMEKQKYYILWNPFQHQEHLCSFLSPHHHLPNISLKYLLLHSPTLNDRQLIVYIMDSHMGPKLSVVPVHQSLASHMTKILLSPGFRCSIVVTKGICVLFSPLIIICLIFLWTISYCTRPTLNELYTS